MLLRNKRITAKQQQNYLLRANFLVFHSASVNFFWCMDIEKEGSAAHTGKGS